MGSQLATIGLAIVAFASTNIDDIFVLLLFFSTPGVRSLQVILGQYLGIGALTFGSLLCSFAARTIPEIYIGLLGLLPLGLGIRELWKRHRQTSDNSQDTAPSKLSGSVVLSVTAVTIANGGDNIGIYTPLFSTRPMTDVGVMVFTFFVMTGLWCAVAHYLVNHPKLKGPIEGYGHRVFPWVLIGLGSFILAEAYLKA